jgi:hypothetical protein
MTTFVSVMTERDWQTMADDQGRPCACTDDAPCLGHYGLLAAPDRARSAGQSASSTSKEGGLMADNLRPQVVARLTESPPLPAALVDQVLDASPAERQAAAGELLDRTRMALEQAGALRPSMSVVDLRIDQVEALVAVYGLVMGWWRQPGWNTRTLGGICKVVPPDVAATAMGVLRAGRYLPPDHEGG